MKENKYDDPAFFHQYSQMNRSKDGLAAAGEWHELKKMLPDFTGKTVLDLGCGFGWHCRYAMENGAAKAIGVDISEKMLEQAKKINNMEGVSYIKSAFEDITYPPETFDIVLSSLAFHYTLDFGEICHIVANCLKKGGSFIFSVEHPIFTAKAPQEWHKDEDGNILHWPVDNYFHEGERKAVFLGEEIIKYHKTLTTYLKSLLDTGFSIVDIVEPAPSKEHLALDSQMLHELRRPMMLLVSAKLN